MSEVDWKSNKRRALLALVQSVRELKGAASSGKSPFVTKAVAAKKLRISQRRLRLLIKLDLVETMRLGRRELVYLP